MSSAYFFGYGSLVNRGTHGYLDAQPATLRGWRRMWRRTNLRKAAYLTVVPDEHCVIDGLVAGVPAGDWAALDQRERAYERQAARHQVNTTLPEHVDLVVYAIADGAHHDPDEESPVLLSYIDVVVQGYLDVYGENGVENFFDTTAGWDAPVLNDRAAPVYPRHQKLQPTERRLVDDHLDRVGARILSPESYRR